MQFTTILLTFLSTFTFASLSLGQGLEANSKSTTLDAAAGFDALDTAIPSSQVHGAETSTSASILKLSAFPALETSTPTKPMLTESPVTAQTFSPGPCQYGFTGAVVCTDGGLPLSTSIEASRSPVATSKLRAGGLPSRSIVSALWLTSKVKAGGAVASRSLVSAPWLTTAAPVFAHDIADISVASTNDGSSSSGGGILTAPGNNSCTHMTPEVPTPVSTATIVTSSQETSVLSIAPGHPGLISSTTIVLTTVPVPASTESPVSIVTVTIGCLNTTAPIPAISSGNVNKVEGWLLTVLGFAILEGVLAGFV